jgi:hypothetical protein
MAIHVSLSDGEAKWPLVPQVALRGYEKHGSLSSVGKFRRATLRVGCDGEDGLWRTVLVAPHIEVHSAPDCNSCGCRSGREVEDAGIRPAERKTRPPPVVGISGNVVERI